MAIALHLLPGAVLLLFQVLAGSWLVAHRLPAIWGLMAGVVLVVIPFEIGAIALSSRGLRVGTVARELGVRRPRRRDIRSLLVLGPVCLLLPGLAVWSERWMRSSLFAWVPSWVGGDAAQLAELPGSLLLPTAILWVVTLVVLGPAVEEVYFRGWLLQRIPGRRPWVGVVVSAGLFAVYHLWQPQSWPTLLLFALPLTLLARRTGNTLLTFLVHASVNVVTFVTFIAGVEWR
ncbi:CPBP family intramembrane glutamic endopeptidase [Tessaracoccus oleiagri]|uniref:CAAX protease self-immunity n=1 Tax=Tessaracoccus oleiagri TaxID=686624 RepID=A0A1G9MUM9_9ACTN|nr:CPBP family intramembrane glutamic endopeptidase [Tessaracoccus oleiagri]SDL77711.1 CAAX protease self-immunity [Tessaracoccus oleiagri]